MSIVITPIPSTIELAAPAFTLGTTNTAGAAVTAVASNSTLLAYDATVPTTIAYSDAANAGSASVSARRDHTHGMAASDSVGQASSAEVKAQTDVNKYVPPDLIKDAPTVAKAYASVNSAGALQSNSFNVASSAKNATGNYTIVWDVDFANENYVSIMVAEQEGNAAASVDSPAVGEVNCYITAISISALDDNNWQIAAFGIQ